MTDDAETIRALKSVDAYRDQVDRIREELGAAPDEPAVYAAKALRKRAEKAEARLAALVQAAEEAAFHIGVPQIHAHRLDYEVKLMSAIAAAKEPTDAN